MISPQMQHERDYLVGLDYGQFSLATADEDPDLAVELIGVALGQDGIAQQDGLVLVTSPHQNNFEMKVRVEIWDAAPVSDVAEWQEAFEVHLDVTDYGLIYGSPTMAFEHLAVPPGAFHALITGRGFVTHGWPGFTEPEDEWRLRLWPSSGPPEPGRLAAFEDEEDSLPDSVAQDNTRPEGADDLRAPAPRSSLDAGGEVERRAAASAAGRRISLDLDEDENARTLSGRFGVARIDKVLPRDRKSLWPLLANLDITTVSAPNEAVVGNQFSMSTYRYDKDGFVGTGGEIVCEWLELDQPSKVVISWAWTTTGQPWRNLPWDATLTFLLTDASTTADEPQTHLVLTHAGIPHEWVDDMTIVWLSRLDQWLYQSRPKRNRR